MSNVLLRLSDASLAVASRPCTSATPCTGAIGDAVTDFIPMGDTYGPYGLVFERGTVDQAFVEIYDGRGPTLFTETGLVAATGIAGFEPAGESGYLAVIRRPGTSWRSTLLLAGSDANGATPGIYGAALLPPFVGMEGPAAGAGAWLDVYPNPASGRVSVQVVADVPSASSTVAMFDALGRRVAVLHDGPLAAGDHAFALDASALPAGVYVVRVEAGAQTTSARLAVVR